VAVKVWKMGGKTKGKGLKRQHRQGSFNFKFRKKAN